MSYHDAWQAYGDWIDSTDADYLKHEGIQDGDIWDCPECESPPSFTRNLSTAAKTLSEAANAATTRSSAKAETTPVFANRKESTLDR